MTDIGFIAGEGGCPSCEMKDAEIERLREQHDNFLQEFWATNARNAKLEGALKWILANTDSEATRIACRVAIAAAEVDDDLL